MSFGTNKKATPQLVNALWDFIKADTPKKVAVTTRKLEKEWKKKPKVKEKRDAK